MQTSKGWKSGAGGEWALEMEVGSAGHKGGEGRAESASSTSAWNPAPWRQPCDEPCCRPVDVSPTTSWPPRSLC